jgi:CheY-like chemotaxis protein
MTSIAPSPTASNGVRILVVDDEEAIRDATREYLSALGYHVDAAQEREEAEAMLATGDYALVIADMRLTGVHGREGLELVGYLRERCPWSRVVVLTAYGSPELESEARRRGADAFIQKPVPLAELARLAGLLVRTAS